MAAATTVILVRHGSHDLLGKVLAGRMAGVSLSAAGRDEAERVAQRLAGEPVAAVYASPLERAQETAEPIAARHGRPVETAPAILEIDFGDWTGRRFDELAADPRWPVWNSERASSRAPGGELMAEAQARIGGALESWRTRHPDRTVVAVSHGDVIKAAVCQVLGLSLDRHDTFAVDPASLTTLVAWAGGGQVVRLNEAAR